MTQMVRIVSLVPTTRIYIDLFILLFNCFPFSIVLFPHFVCRGIWGKCVGLSWGENEIEKVEGMNDQVHGERKADDRN